MEEKVYRFYGSDHDIGIDHPEYPDIHDIRELYDVLCKLWCRETCAPRMRKDWCEENRTLGQCSITAFLVQDILGGEVYGVDLKDGNFHCFNVVNGCSFDLTSEQFLPEMLCYENAMRQSRDVHFAKEEKRLRYVYLKAALKNHERK